MSTDGNPASVVVLLHGLYMTGGWMGLLRRRLEKFGHRAVAFSYSSLGQGAPANADALQRWLAEMDWRRVDFVAHSLGGLVLRHLFHRHPGQRPGRVVTLGTPHQPSCAARSVESLGLGFLLGRSGDEGLLGGIPIWDSHTQIGSVAGSRGLGIGRFFHRQNVPNDGAVTVPETQFEGMTDHVVVPVNHAALIFSRSVARLCNEFLRHGQFRSAKARS